MRFTRRQILVGAATGLAGAGWYARTRRWEFSTFQVGRRAPWAHQLVTAYGEWSPTGNINLIDPPRPSYLAFVNADSFSTRTFRVPFRAHTCIQNPKRPDELVLIPKWWTSIFRFNHREGKLAGAASAPRDHRYFGHGTWDPEADGMWISIHDDRRKRGKVVLVDGDLNVRAEIDTQGMFPHEIQMVEPGVLLVANSGDYSGDHLELPFERRVPSLTWIRSRDGAVLQRVEFPQSLGIAGVSHFAYIPEKREVITGTMIVNQSMPTVVYRVPESSRPERLFADPKDERSFRGEIVSLAYCPDDGCVVWSHSLAPGVFAYDIHKGGLAKLVTPEPAKAVAAYDGKIIIGRGGKPLLLGYSGGRLDVRGEGPPVERYWTPEAPMVDMKWGSHFNLVV